MDGFDEVIQGFVVESYEGLDQLDSDLVAPEDAPEDLDRLRGIFRTVHTIEGFLALPNLDRVAHVGENLLVLLRDGTLSLATDGFSRWSTPFATSSPSSKPGADEFVMRPFTEQILVEKLRLARVDIPSSVGI